MGDLVDLDKFRTLRENQEREKIAEEERKLKEEHDLAEEEQLNYLRSVLDVMLGSLPPVTGAFYMPTDLGLGSDYLFDASNTSDTPYYSSEDESFVSDEDFFSYEWGWASESRDDDES